MADSRFQPRLESIRGIAALMVVLYHALAMVRMEGISLKIRALLQLFGNGNGGVAIFFVLSGYVLARSLDASTSPGLNGATAPGLKTRPPAILTFAARRVLRIWPAMAVCLVACFFWVRFAFEPATSAAASDDYALYWRHGAGGHDLLVGILFGGSYLNPVTWTLAVEMIAALVFVPLWWTHRRANLLWVAVAVGWGVWFLSTPHPPLAAYVYMLLLGFQIDPIARWAARHLGKSVTIVALLLSFLGMGVVMQYPRETSSATWFVQSGFAYAIVALLVSTEGRMSLAVLDHPAARFMGRISYSFYLWNFPILYALVTFGLATIAADRWLQMPNTMALGLFVLSTLITIPVAWGSYGVIEKPMIRAARRIKDQG